MNTFEEFEAAAARAPLSLRNSLDRIRFPVLGVQEEAGQIGFLLEAACKSGRLELTPEQREGLKSRIADVLWYAAVICRESGLSLGDVAAQSIAQIEARMTKFDPDRR